jgi:hypothetical protein
VEFWKGDTTLVFSYLNFDAVICANVGQHSSFTSSYILRTYCSKVNNSEINQMYDKKIIKNFVYLPTKVVWEQDSGSYSDDLEI